jgi:hypothetical protein
MYGGNREISFYPVQLPRPDFEILADDSPSKCQIFIVFTIPGMGQCKWINSAMGLLGCPLTFQRLLEAIVANILIVIV